MRQAAHAAMIQINQTASQAKGDCAFQPDEEAKAAPEPDPGRQERKPHQEPRHDEEKAGRPACPAAQRREKAQDHRVYIGGDRAHRPTPAVGAVMTGVCRIGRWARLATSPRTMLTPQTAS